MYHEDPTYKGLILSFCSKPARARMLSMANYLDAIPRHATMELGGQHQY